MPIGNATVDFGAFPGAPSAYVDIAAPTILAGSHTQGELLLEATADYSLDELIALMPRLRVAAEAATAGVGFRVWVTYDSDGISANAANISGEITIKWVWV